MVEVLLWERVGLQQVHTNEREDRRLRCALPPRRESKPGADLADAFQPSAVHGQALKIGSLLYADATAGAVVDMTLVGPSPEGVAADIDLVGDKFYSGDAARVCGSMTKRHADRVLFLHENPACCRTRLVATERRRKKIYLLPIDALTINVLVEAPSCYMRHSR